MMRYINVNTHTNMVVFPILLNPFMVSRAKQFSLLISYTTAMASNSIVTSPLLPITLPNMSLKLDGGTEEHEGPPA